MDNKDDVEKLNEKKIRELARKRAEALKKHLADTRKAQQNANVEISTEYFVNNFMKNLRENAKVTSKDLAEMKESLKKEDVRQELIACRKTVELYYKMRPVEIAQYTKQDKNIIQELKKTEETLLQALTDNLSKAKQGLVRTYKDITIADNIEAALLQQKKSHRSLSPQSEQKQQEEQLEFDEMMPPSSPPPGATEDSELIPPASSPPPSDQESYDDDEESTSGELPPPPPPTTRSRSSSESSKGSKKSNR